MESMMNFTALQTWKKDLLSRAIIENAKKTYILADDSKIGVTSFVKVAQIKRAMIITNQCETATIKGFKEKTEVIEV